MSAGTNRQSGHTYHTYQNYPFQSYRCQTCRCQTYRLHLNAAAISAAARVDVRCAPRPSLGLQPFIGEAPGCQSIPRGRC